MLEYTFIFIFVLITAMAGVYLNLLSFSGSLASFVIGLAVGYGFGVQGLLVLGFFFASSSLWSKYKSTQKLKVADKHEKGSRRDWRQVAANGGLACFASFFYLAYPSEIWLMGFLISLASANSDTWASEIGSLSKKPPISIRTFKPIETGTSGAISTLGTFAAFLGSSAIALLSLFLFKITFFDAFFIFIFGFAGNAIDSVLGAFLQAKYKCNVCGAAVEKLIHCGQKTNLAKGKHFADNDFVNFFSGLASAALGMLLYILL
ncbi:DUF92 domain-containing protein [Cytobacillus sp. NCCP-133]|uniref:DUF92 domain-containing protein n=1 Tax=Cytobacillus sp. NCCP-133 TaxID=766848 RepID=UPI0022322293|nr:DUF92 domain-containing protein [Cytobacillus sp. NCCP-133]GLB58197.1 hypothetical protein NCCP133_03300 [Cytobacillus sp. NCCP-133]